MTLYLDCDGVLADFNKHAYSILGMMPMDYEKLYGSDKFWAALGSDPDFYFNLELLEDALELYNGVKHLDPVILSGVPSQMPAGHEQKKRWSVMKFGPSQAIITCQAKKKNLYCKPGDIIIDDRPKYKPLWEATGGIWITHITAKNSLAELKALGVPICESMRHT